MKAFFARIQSKLKQFPRRTLVLAVVFVLLFSIPTILAIRSTKKAQTVPEKPSFSVTLSDENRSPFAFATASEDPTTGSNMADILYRVITEGKSIERLPFLPEDGTPIYASVNQNGKQTEYICYFSLSGQDSYYMDPEGHIFLIENSATADFLLLPESEHLYDNAKPTKLLTNTLEEIIPSFADWSYELYDGTYKPASSCITTNDVRSYEFSGALELFFEKEPQSCDIRAIETNTGEIIYEGSHQGLSSIVVDPGTTLQISVRAEWKKQASVENYGSLSYDFFAVIRDRSTFSLNKTALTSGDFLILTCTNIQSLDKLSLQCEHALTRYTYTSGNTVFFVIPFPTEITAPEMKFTVTYGASTSQFTISLLESPTANDVFIPSTNDTLNAAIAEQAQRELTALLAKNHATSSLSIYFQGNIRPMTEYGFTQGYTFGDRITILGNDTPLSAIGTEYLAASGTAVPALISGTVAATGYCDALGHYVVLDHGLGIQTWYAHLSDLDVRIGDIVAIGQSVGKAGIGGVYSGSGVLLLCTVGGHTCDPKSITQ